jgi:hypothetical protein
MKWIRNNIGWLYLGSWGKGSFTLHILRWKIVERYRTTDGDVRWSCRQMFVSPDVIVH